MEEPIINENKSNSSKSLIYLTAILAFVSIGAMVFFGRDAEKGEMRKETKEERRVENVNASNIKKFSSEQEFKDYLTKGAPMFVPMGRGGITFSTQESANFADAISSKASPQRVSETNIQVVGIDEPDIVKTDGENIYFSKENNWLYAEERSAVSSSSPMEIMPNYEKRLMQIVRAFPVSELEKVGEIDKNGNLLLFDDILVIFSYQKIYGYDISDLKNPKQKWSTELKSNNQVAGVRKFGDRIYLIVNTSLNSYRPCPIEILNGGSQISSVSCQDIYHPIKPISVDSTYTIMKIDPEDGRIENSSSFVGSANNSVVYMSNNAIYVTYNQQGDF
jgi:inhibitor of cysteine peptidase